MAQDPPKPNPAGGPEPGPSPPASANRSAALASAPVPFEQSFATPRKPRGELSDDDLRDIQDLLSQEQDVTRQDIRSQNFQELIDRYTQGKKVD